MLPDLLLAFADDYKILNHSDILPSVRAAHNHSPYSVFDVWRTVHHVAEKTSSRRQPIRSDGPETHILTKAGTPTMGGLLILGSFILPPYYGSPYPINICGRFC